jgi:hypothetical protein
MSKSRKYVGAPYVVGSDTSEDAARSMVPHLSRLEAELHALIIRSGPEGMTCDECEIVGEIIHQTCSARIRSLVKKNAIYDSGARRPTRSGRAARVYVATEFKPPSEPVGSLRRIRKKTR